MKAPAGDQAAASVLFEREYSPREAQILMSLLAVSEAFVDVGANLGYFSLLALFRSSDRKPVIAIEPNPFLSELIGENLALNGFRSGRTVCAAIGSAVCECDLLIDKNQSSTARIGRGGKPRRSVASTRCRVLRLDDVFTTFRLDRALVKVDVEGAELDVLLGGRLALRSGSIFFTEVSRRTAPELCEMISKYGYRALTDNGDFFEPKLRGGKVPNRTLIFVPASEAVSVSEVVRRNCDVAQRCDRP